MTGQFQERLEQAAARFPQLGVAARVRMVGQLAEAGVPMRELKTALGLSRFDLSHYRRLGRRLAGPVLDLVERAGLTFGHARAIARLPLPQQEAFARDVIQRRWSAHRTESEAKRALAGAQPGPDAHYYGALAETISEQIGHPVTVTANPARPQSGTIAIAYADFDCFDSILARMRVKLPE